MLRCARVARSSSGGGRRGRHGEARRQDPRPAPRRARGVGGTAHGARRRKRAFYPFRRGRSGAHGRCGGQGCNQTCRARRRAHRDAAGDARADPRADGAKKGDVLGVARIAAIQAAKRTAELIPLCHPLPLTRVAVEFALDAGRARRRHRGHGRNARPHRRRDGGADRRGGRPAHDLRHVQGRRSRHADRGRAAAREVAAASRATYVAPLSRLAGALTAGALVRWLDHLTDYDRRAVESAGLATRGRRSPVAERADAAPATEPQAGAAPRGGVRVPLQTVEPLRLYRQIAGQIAALIDNGEFPAGSRLPAERELATLLGVSRTSVREAIISLEIAGRVEVRVGTGIFVRRSRARRARCRRRRPTRAPGPFELLAARALIEGEIAALAARNAQEGAISPRCARRSSACATHADDFAQARRRRPRVPRADRRGDAATARCALVVAGPVGAAARRAVDAHREPISTRRSCATATLLDHAAISMRSRRATPTRRATRCTAIWRASSANSSAQWDVIVPAARSSGTARAAPSALRKRNASTAVAQPDEGGACTMKLN